MTGTPDPNRNLVCERNKSALAVKKANGQRTGSIPYGFNLDPDGSTLLPNKSEQAVIQDVRAMRGRGMVLAKIANELTARCVPTKTGKSDHWTHQAVARILKRQPK